MFVTINSENLIYLSTITSLTLVNSVTPKCQHLHVKDDVLQAPPHPCKQCSVCRTTHTRKTTRSILMCASHAYHANSDSHFYLGSIRSSVSLSPYCGVHSWSPWSPDGQKHAPAGMTTTGSQSQRAVISTDDSSVQLNQTRKLKFSKEVLGTSQWIHACALYQAFSIRLLIDSALLLLNRFSAILNRSNTVLNASSVR